MAQTCNDLILNTKWLILSLNYYKTNQIMGKGDKKTKRGKIRLGTYGARRKRKKTAAYKPPVVKEVPAPKKKVKAKKKEEPETEE